SDRTRRAASYFENRGAIGCTRLHQRIGKSGLRGAPIGHHHSKPRFCDLGCVQCPALEIRTGPIGSTPCTRASTAALSVQQSPARHVARSGALTLVPRPSYYIESALYATNLR